MASSSSASVSAGNSTNGASDHASRSSSSDRRSSSSSSVSAPSVCATRVRNASAARRTTASGSDSAKPRSFANASAARKRRARVDRDAEIAPSTPKSNLSPSNLATPTSDADASDTLAFRVRVKVSSVVSRADALRNETSSKREETETAFRETSAAASVSHASRSAEIAATRTAGDARSSRHRAITHTPGRESTASTHGVAFSATPTARDRSTALDKDLDAARPGCSLA